MSDVLPDGYKNWHEVAFSIIGDGANNLCISNEEATLNLSKEWNLLSQQLAVAEKVLEHIRKESSYLGKKYKLFQNLSEEALAEIRKLEGK